MDSLKDKCNSPCIGTSRKTNKREKGFEKNRQGKKKGLEKAQTDNIPGIS